MEDEEQNRQIGDVQEEAIDLKEEGENMIVTTAEVKKNQTQSAEQTDKDIINDKVEEFDVIMEKKVNFEEANVDRDFENNLLTEGTETFINNEMDEELNEQQIYEQEEETVIESLENVVEFIQAFEDDLILDTGHLSEDEENDEIEELKMLAREFINKIIDESLVIVEDKDIVERLQIKHNISSKIIEDILDSVHGSEDTASIDKPVELDADNSGTLAAKELIDDLIDRCLPMNRIAKDFIYDIINKLYSPAVSCRTVTEGSDDSFSMIKQSDLTLTIKLDERDEIEECFPFTNVNNIANSILEGFAIKGKGDVFQQLKVVIREKVKFRERVLDKFPWPNIEHFTIDKCLKTIILFIHTWDYKENWLFNVEYLMAQSNECSDFYLYEAKFGIPTNPYPIPQATVSVFFTIEVSRVLPKVCPVNITYVFEGNRVVHDGTGNYFHEDWLFNVIDAKLELFKRLDF